MPGMFDQWDEKRERATRPAEPVTPPPSTRSPEWLDRAARYARAALDGEVANIVAVPVGSGRNDQLNKSAVKMGHYIAAGAIDERTVVEVLGAADGGLDYPATAKTIASGIEAGKRTPAAIPEPPALQHRNPAPWETGYVPQQEAIPAWSDPTDPFENDSLAPSAPSPGTEATSGTSTPSDPASSSPSSDGATVAAPPSTDDALYQARVIAEAAAQRLRRDARRLLDNEDAVRDFRVPPYLPSLTDELALPDEPVQYIVDELFPAGANVLLTAQFKTGKTTMVNNLVRSLADGLPFLERFAVDPPDGRIVIFNYEVSEAQYRRWLREVGIRNTDRVSVLNLRGYRLPLTVPHIEAWVVDYLRRAEARVWIVDPFARAFVGSGDENDNGETGVWLDTLDVIKERSGVTELIMPNHTGRAEQETGQERGRGATRLDDWADVRWLLTKDKHATRYFRASGRDVETDEAALDFDPATRTLTLTDGDRRTIEDRRYDDAVLAALRVHNVLGLKELREAVSGILGTASNDKVDRAVGRLVAGHKVAREQGKPGTPTRHMLTSPATSGDPFA